jgi:hypothetical protein
VSSASPAAPSTATSKSSPRPGCGSNRPTAARAATGSRGAVVPKCSASGRRPPSRRRSRVPSARAIGASDPRRPGGRRRRAGRPRGALVGGRPRRRHPARSGGPRPRPRRRELAAPLPRRRRAPRRAPRRSVAIEPLERRHPGDPSFDALTTWQALRPSMLTKRRRRGDGARHGPGPRCAGGRSLGTRASRHLEEGAAGRVLDQEDEVPALGADRDRRRLGLDDDARAARSANPSRFGTSGPTSSLIPAPPPAQPKRPERSTARRRAGLG